MADRFPLILNTSTNQIQEIPSGDSLDLTGSGITNAGIITAGNVTIGAATTDLIVNGDARITGILTIGTSSLKLDGPNNLVNVGTALTLGHTQGLQFHTQNLHSAGFEVNQINVSGASTMGNDVTFNGASSKNMVWDSSDGALDFVDNATIKMGNNNDLSFSHDGTSSRIQDSYGALFIGSNLIELKTGNLGEIYLSCNANGAVSLRHNNVTKIETTSSGVTITGDGTFTGNVSIGGTLTYEDVTNIDSIGIITARNGITVSSGTATFQGAIDANGDLDVDGHTNLDNVSIAGVSTFTGAVTTGDHITLSGQNPRITFTDTNHNPDFELYGSAGNFKIWDSTNAIGRLVVNSDGHIDIPGNLDCGAGIDVTGNVNATGNIHLADNGYLKIGTGNDLELFHNGVNTFIRNNTGYMVISSESGSTYYDAHNHYFRKADSSEYMAKFFQNGAVELYYDNTVVLKTHDASDYSGITVLGDEGGHAVINLFADEGDDAADQWQWTAQTNGASYIKNYSNGSTWEYSIKMNGGGAVELYHDNSAKKLETTGSGVAVTGQLVADNGLKVNDGNHITLGTDNDLRLYFDGSNAAWNNQVGNSYFYGGGGNFYIRPVNAEQALNIHANGSIELFHDNAKKVETYANGIIVYGPEAGGGLINLYADEGDDNADKWRLHSNPNGSFYLQNYASGSWEDSILASGNGTVELYNDATKRFATTSTGVAITGMADATGNSARFRTIESGGASVEIRSGGAEGYIGTQTNHKISFITNASRAMTLINNAEHQLCVGVKGETGNTSATSTVGWVLTGGWTKGVFSGATGVNTPWTLYNEHSNFNRYMAYVRFDGGVMSHQSNDGNLCDERIKQDFDTVSSQWDNIKNIGLKKFRYKNEPSDAKLKIGVIAQQVETIYPDLVEEDWPIGDANPNTHEKNTGDFYKSVKEEQLQMYSLKALQEAMARIETLEAEVAALKGS